MLIILGYWLRAHAIEKNTEALFITSKKSALEVNTEKMVKSHEKNGGQYHNIKMGIKSIENVVQLKYLNNSNTTKFHS
jgi:hypothetical protein